LLLPNFIRVGWFIVMIVSWTTGNRYPEKMSSAVLVWRITTPAETENGQSNAEYDPFKHSDLSQLARVYASLPSRRNAPPDC
jgi:hypothetical protein